jgi:hypothetical protein
VMNSDERRELRGRIRDDRVHNVEVVLLCQPVDNAAIAISPAQYECSPLPGYRPDHGRARAANSAAVPKRGQRCAAWVAIT